MLIPEEDRIDLLEEHTVDYYLEVFEGAFGMADRLKMNNVERAALLNDIILFRMLKILEDHCE